LVLPNPVVAAYRALRARVADRRDAYKKDLRLLISNEAHGDDGGNFAVTDDIFTWIDRTLRGKSPLRAAQVAIAQQWAGDTFRLERDWPIPGTTATRLYLSRIGTSGKLVASPPRGSQSADRLINAPFISSPPGEPVPNEAWQGASTA